MLKLLDKLDDPDVPLEEKENIVRDLLARIPAQGEGEALMECAADAKRLSEQMLAGKPVTRMEMKALLARTYESYAEMLQANADQVASEDEEAAEKVDEVARGYQLLAEGTRFGDIDKLNEGLQMLQEAGQALQQYDLPEDTESEEVAPAGPMSALELLRDAARGMEEGSYTIEDFAVRLEGMQNSLREAEERAGIDESMWEDPDPLVQGMRLYVESLEAAWSYVRDESDDGLEIAIEKMEEAERLLTQVAEEEDPDDTPDFHPGKK